MAEQNHPPGLRTVAEAVDAYRADAQARHRARTVEVDRWRLGRFRDRFGDVPLAELTAEQVEADAARPGWNDTTRHNYLATAQTCSQWAGLRLRLRKPPKARAGAESIIPEATFRQMVLRRRGAWNAVLVFLWHSGFPPGRAAAITAADVDWERRAVRVPERKRHGVRLVYLNPDAYAVLAGQRQRYKAGLLFRSPQHQGPLTARAFTKKFLRLSRRVGRRVTAGGLRHTFLARALASGATDGVIAALAGIGVEQVRRLRKRAASARRALTSHS